MNALWLVVLSLLLLLSVPVARSAESAGFAITVSAGKQTRRDVIVEFALPEGLKTVPSALSDPAGNQFPLQLSADGRATFLLPGLEAGQSVVLQAVTGTESPSHLKLDATKTRVAFTLRDKPVLTYNHARTPLPEGFEPAYHRGGYIFPVLSPSGKLVVDDYPPNHKHHHGIWAAWTKTSFDGRKPDFWNMGQKTGTVEPVALDATWCGPVHAGFKARHRYIDLSAKPEPVAAINETWEGRLYSTGASDARYHIFDLTITHTCTTDKQLTLPKYHYGGIGVRGNRTWDGKDNATFLTSEGKTRANGNETSGRWVHIGGQVDGTPTGMAVLCHPGNFRAPQPLRLHPTEPFLSYAPSQGGDWAIKPGDTYVMRYRFVVADGAADSTELNRLWTDYAEPPVVELKPAP